MDIILSDHTPQNLETTFNSVFLYDHPLYSLLAKQTEMTWLLVIPKQSLEGSAQLEYVQNLYGEIYRLIGFIQDDDIGQHFNIAKIGNKLPYQHIHLIFRENTDEVWPDAVWCHEPITASEETPKMLKKALAAFYSERSLEM
ncbi:MAG: hypothetical protein JXK16_06210 [Thiotrichales bacterium]|nr:hypothetical protein [Thiotrichales bacterium]